MAHPTCIRRCRGAWQWRAGPSARPSPAGPDRVLAVWEISRRSGMVGANGQIAEGEFLILAFDLLMRNTLE